MAKFKSLYEAAKPPVLTGDQANQAALPFFKFPGAEVTFNDGIITSFIKSKVSLIRDYKFLSFKLNFSRDFELDMRVDSTDRDVSIAKNADVQQALANLVKKAGFGAITVKEFSGRIIVRADDLTKDPGKALIKLAKSLTPASLDKIFASVYGKELPMQDQLAKFVKASKVKATKEDVGARVKFVNDKATIEDFNKFKAYMDSQNFSSNSSSVTSKTWMLSFGRYVGVRLTGSTLEITHYS